MGKVFITVIEKQNVGDKNKHSVDIIKENDNNYLVVSNAYLRLRLDKHIDRKDIKLSNCYAGMCVDLGSGIIMANARVNMNPFIVKAKSERENGLYIIVDDSHKIIYTEVHDGAVVKNTFKSKDANTGAIIAFKSTQTDIVTVYTESNGRLYKFHYTSVNGIVTMKVKPITDVDIIADVKDKGKFAFNKFKITITQPFTDHYIVSSEKAAELKTLLEKHRNFGSKNLTISIVENNDFASTIKFLKDSKVKVITEYGILLPIEAVNELKLNSIFTMNKECKLNCLRSK